MKFESLIRAVTVSVVLCGSLQAATVVNWTGTGNYVTANQNMANMAVGNATTTGNTRTWVYNPSVANTPASGYTVPSGMSGPFYATAQITSPTATIPTLTSYVENNATADRLGFQLGPIAGNTNPGVYSLQTLTYFQQGDFLNDGDSGTVTFDDSSSVSMTLQNFGVTGATNYARFAVRDGSTWYLSQASLGASFGVTLTIDDFATAQWVAWDPSGTVQAIAPSSGFSSHSFTDVTAVGVYTFIEANVTTAGGFASSKFVRLNMDAVVTIPEPGSGGMAVLGIASLLGLARKNRRRTK